MLITTSEALAAFCDALSDAPYIAVDTEFLRERTYYAQLCLVQVAYGDHAACIDPLAPDLDLSPLRELLHNPRILKVLHSATQDLEIFLQATGKVPGPVFDSQIAASVCGQGEQPGYAKLVSSMLGIQLDKSSQVTDWSVRPLSKRQLDYALGDVTHLCVIYEKLAAELKSTGREDWVAEEMNALLDPSRYTVTPEDAYKRIRIRRPKSETLAVLRELAAWRENEAIKRNIPRGWVARDEALVEIAQSLPDSEAEIGRIRALKPNQSRGAAARAMLDAVDDALDSPKDSWPVPKESRKTVKPDSATVALLQTLLDLRCQQFGVAKSVVAKRQELDRIAVEEDPKVPALSGWRRHVFGEAALDLVAGRIALGRHEGKVIEMETE